MVFNHQAFNRTLTTAYHIKYETTNKRFYVIKTKLSQTWIKTISIQRINKETNLKKRILKSKKRLLDD